VVVLVVVLVVLVVLVVVLLLLLLIVLLLLLVRVCSYYRPFTSCEFLASAGGCGYGASSSFEPAALAKAKVATCSTAAEDAAAGDGWGAAALADAESTVRAGGDALQLQSRTAFDGWSSMELAATPAQTAAITKAAADAKDGAVAVVEARENQVRMLVLVVVLVVVLVLVELVVVVLVLVLLLLVMLLLLLLLLLLIRKHQHQVRMVYQLPSPWAERFEATTGGGGAASLSTLTASARPGEAWTFSWRCSLRSATLPSPRSFSPKD